MNDITVLVPSWAPLSPEMQAETGSKYAAFIPLGGSPLYERIVAQYQHDLDRIRIVFLLAEDAPEIAGDRSGNISTEVLRLRASGSIGETVLAGLERIAPDGAVVVQMADTLLGIDAIPSGDAIYVQSRGDLYRWTSIAADSSGCIRVVNDRDETRPCEPRPVCVGLFSFTDAAWLTAALRKALEHRGSHREPFFAAVEDYSSARPMDLRPIERWMDCGHVDGYYESRLCYQNLRHFNSLSFDPVRGRVTKRSANAEAFRKQVRWFKQAPDEVAPFLPRVFASNDGADPFITLELLSIPTLGDLFISQRLQLGAWNDVVRSIACIQSCFADKAIKSSLAPQLARAIYLDKTRSRLNDFIAQDPSAKDYFVRREDQRWSIGRVQRTLPCFVEQHGLLALDELVPIHGDFCFSNLLYDSKVRLVKMIDPRGEFGVPGIFGDRLYDLAKLAHSYAGGYDFITADRFSVTTDCDGCLSVRVPADDYSMRVRSIFDAVLLPDPVLRRQVDALQALLFLSMLPLHADKPNRQLAMLATGLALYSRCWSVGAQA
jgi:hypothetical protein